MSIKNKIDLKKDLSELGASLKTKGQYFICSEDYELTDSMADHELGDPRTDIFCLWNQFSNFKSLEFEVNKKFTNSVEDIIPIFDSLLSRLCCFLKGDSMITLFYSFSLLHNQSYMKPEKNNFLFLVVQGFFNILSIINKNVKNTGFLFYDDYCITQIPSIKIFEATNTIDLLEDIFSGENFDFLKSSCLIISKKIV